MDYVLGLDGGGTKVLVQLATADGVVMGEAAAGPCNIAAMPVAEALANAVQACHHLLAEHEISLDNIRALCAGVAGYSAISPRSEFLAGLQSHFPTAVVTVEPDYAVALTGATRGAPGVVVIAGTGSVAYGENADGLSHRSGAYGYLIDDAGSGYGVGRAGLAAVLRAFDGTGEPTALTSVVLTALNLSKPWDIVPAVYGGPVDRVTIASLSRVVSAAAKEGDSVARQILMRAGGALAQLAHGVTQTIFTGDVPFPIVTIGSLWQAGPALTDVFERSIRRFAPHATFAKPQNPPAYGAVLRAISSLASSH